MPIDVDTPQSPGWWLQKLSWKLEHRQDHLADLDARFRGDAPPPESPNASTSAAYQAFRRKSRTNFAALIVEAVKQRMQVRGFRTGAEADDNGDLAARRVWAANDLDVEAADVHASMLALGDAYVIVGEGDDGPVITGEDPRQVVTVHDPVQQRKVRAGLKVFVDADEGREFAYLYLPGRVLVASHEIGFAPRRLRAVRFSPRSWDWDDDRSGDLPFGMLPVVRFRNRRGVGEFEEHRDLLDRIDHQVFQRLVIATMQAYKQRILLDAPLVDENGEEIDYGILKAGPDELWTLPIGAKLWESGQVDLTPVLAAVKDDLRSLSAVTQTPFHMLSPEGANQSAEGASLAREGQVAKAKDRIARATGGWKDVMSLAFLVAKDEERADRAELEVLWEDPEQRSLAEIADAASKAQDIPWRTRMEKIWRFTPGEVDRMESERAADMINQFLGSPAANPPAPVPQPTVGEQFVGESGPVSGNAR